MKSKKNYTKEIGTHFTSLLKNTRTGAEKHIPNIDILSLFFVLAIQKNWCDRNRYRNR